MSKTVKYLILSILKGEGVGGRLPDFHGNI